MKINFLIPTTGLTGGVKVIFYHATNLIKFGHQVCLIHPFILDKKSNFKDKILAVLKFFKYKTFDFLNLNSISFFELPREIKIKRVFNLKEENIPEADITVATANQTADWLVDYPRTKGEKFYFIQDYETWTRDKNLVDATWKMPLKKIVISSWLKNLAQNYFNEKIFGLVPDGLDLKIFNPENRTKNKSLKILMQYHPLEKKGFIDGLAAFLMAKQEIPDIDLTIFSAYPLPKRLKRQYEFYYRPKLNKLKELYCSTDIFLWPSRVEGFGLPPMEAMACGCAVISTDTGAIRDYSIPDETVILTPPNQPEIMAGKIICLANSKNKMEKIGRAASERMKQFDWQDSTRKLEKIFSNKTS